MNLQDMKNMHPENQKELFKRLSGVRKKAKVVSYSAVYGVGKSKLSRTTGMSEEDASNLLEAFWDLNWAVKRIAETATIRTIGGKLWLYNPVSRFWISLRYEKDIFSSLNQSTGVFCFDSWLAQCWAKGIKGIFQAHDEVIVPISAGKEEGLYKAMKESIKKVNDNLNLHVALDIDPKFGGRYSDVH